MATTWTSRTPVTTDWIGRRRPIQYMAPLQDAYRKVHDQNNNIIYILSNEWKPIVLTNWKVRKPI